MGKPASNTMVNATEKRLEEVEIKMAFLEKELEEYKEASRGFYRKINELEEEVRKLQKDVQESDLPTPDVTWDSEGRNIRP
jgi:septal ring factor EnvC (AmiA/AmiB activator)